MIRSPYLRTRRDTATSRTARLIVVQAWLNTGTNLTSRTYARREASIPLRQLLQTIITRPGLGVLAKDLRISIMNVADFRDPPPQIEMEQNMAWFSGQEAADVQEPLTAADMITFPFVLITHDSG